MREKRAHWARKWTHAGFFGSDRSAWAVEWYGHGIGSGSGSLIFVIGWSGMVPRTASDHYQPL
jgi:hypothetical protein